MLKGYKTMIVNAVVVIFMALSLFVPDAEVPTPEAVGDVVDATDKLISDGQALYISGLAIVNMALRAVTTSPMFNKGD